MCQQSREVFSPADTQLPETLEEGKLNYNLTDGDNKTIPIAYTAVFKTYELCHNDILALFSALISI